MYYIDTSALLPYYRPEPSSDQVQAFFSEQSQPLILSHLSKVEFASALARWVRMSELDEISANKIESAFHEDIQQGLYQFTELGPTEFNRAMQWLLKRKTPLRTLDALHIAAAEAASATLVSCDKNMLQAAEFFGLPNSDICSYSNVGLVHPCTAKREATEPTIKP